jgi:hypothetical protein
MYQKHNVDFFPFWLVLFFFLQLRLKRLGFVETMINLSNTRRCTHDAKHTIGQQYSLSLSLFLAQTSKVGR